MVSLVTDAKEKVKDTKRSSVFLVLGAGMVNMKVVIKKKGFVYRKSVMTEINSLKVAIAVLKSYYKVLQPVWMQQYLEH